jgi:hypothetical protein
MTHIRRALIVVALLTAASLCVAPAVAAVHRVPSYGGGGHGGGHGGTAGTAAGAALAWRRWRLAGGTAVVRWRLLRRGWYAGVYWPFYGPYWGYGYYGYPYAYYGGTTVLATTVRLLAAALWRLPGEGGPDFAVVDCDVDPEEAKVYLDGTGSAKPTSSTVSLSTSRSHPAIT